MFDGCDSQGEAKSPRSFVPYYLCNGRRRSRPMKSWSEETREHASPAINKVMRTWSCDFTEFDLLPEFLVCSHFGGLDHFAGVPENLVTFCWAHLVRKRVEAPNCRLCAGSSVGHHRGGVGARRRIEGDGTKILAVQLVGPLSPNLHWLIF